MVFSIAIWASLVVAEASLEENPHAAHREHHDGHAAQQRARERVAEAAARPDSSLLAKQEVQRSRTRPAAQQAPKRTHRSFVDRSDSRHRYPEDTGDPGDSHETSDNEERYEGRTRDGHDDRSERRAHQEQLKPHGGAADNRSEPDAHQGQHRQKDNFDMPTLLSLQDGHRAKSVVEREKEADVFCSRKDLTKKELEGCRVRKNATKMNEYALHVTDALRMKRIVKASERVAHRAEMKAEQESSTLDELERSLESRRVARFHERPRVHEKEDKPVDVLWILHERKIELALILLFGGVLVSCVNVYGKADRPRRRLRLQDENPSAPQTS